MASSIRTFFENIGPKLIAFVEVISESYENLKLLGNYLSDQLVDAAWILPPMFTIPDVNLLLNSNPDQHDDIFTDYYNHQDVFGFMINDTKLKCSGEGSSV